MSKMILGKRAENGKSRITPKCRNFFRQLGKNVENCFCGCFKKNLRIFSRIYLNWLNISKFKTKVPLVAYIFVYSEMLQPDFLYLKFSCAYSTLHLYIIAYFIGSSVQSYN